MGSVLADVRYGLRMLSKAKGLAIVAILSLSLGIGANTAILTLVDGLLFRPHPIAAPHEVVQIYTGERSSPYEGTSYPSYRDLRDRNGVLAGLAGYGLEQFKLGSDAGPEPVWGEIVTENFFDVLGVRAAHGRGFLSHEGEAPGRDPVAVVSHSLWKRRFGADPALVGRTIRVNGQQLTVVGIAPPEFTGMMRGLSVELWVPAMTNSLLDPGNGDLRVSSRGSRWMTLVGRLAPGRTLADARERFALLTAELQAAEPEEWNSAEDGRVRTLALTVLPERATRMHPQMRPVVYAVAALLVVVVDLVLLIAGLNLAGVLLARAIARRGEMAVRLALGASRRRIVRQLLTESLMVSLAAAALGVVLARWGLDALLASIPALPEGVRVALDLQLDGSVLFVSLAFAVAAGVLLGLAPALHGARAPVASLLQSDAAAVTGRHARSRVRSALIVAQVAVAQLLLIGAGLVWRSLENVRPSSLGFASEDLVVASVSLDEFAHDRRTSQLAFERVAERVASVPGVTAASLHDGIPGGFMGRMRRGVAVAGGADRVLEIDVTTAGPRHFTAMGMPFIAGRDFEWRDRDGAPCVAIVNAVFAERYLDGASRALGRQLLTTNRAREDGGPGCEVIGVIRDDAWQSLVSEVRPFFALALLQTDTRRSTLFVRTSGDPADLVPAVGDAIREIDPSIPVTDVMPLAGHFDVGLYPFRVAGAIIGACGVLAFLLAAIGIYGIVSYSVAQRRREIGIRLALGAERGSIVRLVVGQIMRLVGWGLVSGLLLAAISTRVLASGALEGGVLFGVSALDPATFIAVTLVLLVVALAASLVPARRASRTDPAGSLRAA